MSRDHYAPPRARLSEDRAEGTGTFEIAVCLSEAWTATWAGFPLWLGAGIVLAAAAVLAVFTVLGIPLLLPALYWGGVLFLLNMLDGRAAFRDLFAGFSSYGATLVTMLPLLFLLFLLSLPGQAVQAIGEWMESLAVAVTGWGVNVAWTFLVLVRLYFAPFLVVDRGMGAIESLQVSWSATRGLTGRLVLLLLLTYVVGLVGFFALIVGLIPASVIASLMWVSAYRQIVGRPHRA